MPHATSKKKQPKVTECYKLKENMPFSLLESFRNLVTNIGFAVPKKPDGTGRVVCVSSAIASEGKTTVAVNLAISCANNGAKTILIDCDMRRPAIRKYFSVETSAEILDYLSGQVKLEDVMAHNVAKNLDVIVCRKTAPNPLALLKNENFKVMLDKLAAEYDYVIVDTPPLGIVSDALAVAEQTDGIILVARQMMSTRPLLQQVLSDIDFAGVTFLGFVLNDYNLKNAGKGYYKKYKYKYKGTYQ